MPEIDLHVVKLNLFHTFYDFRFNFVFDIQDLVHRKSMYFIEGNQPALRVAGEWFTYTRRYLLETLCTCQDTRFFSLKLICLHYYSPASMHSETVAKLQPPSSVVWLWCGPMKHNFRTNYKNVNRC